MGMDIANSVVGTSNTASYTDTTSNTDFYNGTSIDTDASDINFWTPEWTKWHGYYEDVPIYAAVIDTLAAWTVGKGFKGKDKDKLKGIRGFGKDDINSIFENQLRTALICGDSHAEIMKDKAGRLTNLKPLNPGRMKQYVNEFGILRKYGQIVSVGKELAFDKKDIFHLCWNRLADEIHGKPLGARAEPIIKQIKQLTEDLGLRFHRIVKPVRLYEANTDDATTLATTETKLKAGYANCEFIVIPAGTLEAKDVATIPSADDALTYLEELFRQLVTAMNCPEIIMGWSKGSTEAGGKIVYLSFQQPTERKQKFMEEQIRLQLNMEVEFEFPASLEPAMTTPGVTGTMGGAKISTPAEDNAKHSKLNTINPAK